MSLTALRNFPVFLGTKCLLSCAQECAQYHRELDESYVYISGEDHFQNYVHVEGRILLSWIRKNRVWRCLKWRK